MIVLSLAHPADTAEEQTRQQQADEDYKDDNDGKSQGWKEIINNE